MKKVLVLLLVVAIVVMVAPSVVNAQGPGHSDPGGERYDWISSNPNPEAQCGTGAGSGAFGYFGRDMNLSGGADGYQTGLNNSAVCGNRP